MRTIALLALSLILPLRAGAIIVFDNGVPVSAVVDGNPAYSDASSSSPTQRLAEDFAFDTPTRVNEILFYGVYFFDFGPPDQNPAPPPDDFELQFYSDAGGLPGVTIGSPTPLSVTRTDTGLDLQGFGLPEDIFEYIATFPDVDFLAGNYWVSVTNDTPSSPDSFAILAESSGRMALLVSPPTTPPWRAIPFSFPVVLFGPPGPIPYVTASKQGQLVIDEDGDNRIDPGDAVRYSISIRNSGTANTENASLSDLPDPNSSLVAGSVTTTRGTVVSGNNPGDIAVQVDLGAVAATGGEEAITFEVRVNDPFPAGVLTIQNQGQVSGGNFGTVLTDDLGTVAVRDATVTQVANTELDICERDLGQCEEDLAECQSSPPFADADSDGEHDQTDHCPGTAPGAAVDTGGCSLTQFCNAIDLTSSQPLACNLADWGNDEPVGNPRDCKAAQQCVPR